MTNFLNISDLISGKDGSKISDQDIDFSNPPEITDEIKEDNDDLERKKTIIIMLLKKGRGQ